MPIFEYYCEKCDKKFEEIWKSEEVREYSEIEQWFPCPLCFNTSYRVPSGFAFNQQGILTGVDDTDEFTLGKLVANRGIPAEFKPTLQEIQEREKKKKENKEYRNRVKKYQLDKPTKAEREAEGKPGDIVIVDR